MWVGPEARLQWLEGPALVLWTISSRSCSLAFVALPSLARPTSQPEVPLLFLSLTSVKYIYLYLEHFHFALYPCFWLKQLPGSGLLGIMLAFLQSFSIPEPTVFSSCSHNTEITCMSFFQDRLVLLGHLFKRTAHLANQGIGMPKNTMTLFLVALTVCSFRVPSE